MSEEIVACPACAKKFRIPEGAPGGTFQCTACSADVPYGRAGRAGHAAPQPARAAPPRHAAPAAASRARGSRGRGREPEAFDDRGRRVAPPAGGNQAVIWVMVGVIVVGVTAFLMADKGPAKEPTPTKPPATTPAATAPVTPPVVPPVAPPPANPAPSPPAAAGAGDGGISVPDAGSFTPATPNTGLAGAGSMDSLMLRIADVAGVTPQERAAIEKDVEIYCDQEAGMTGIDAGTRLRKLGRKAVPALLSTFESQWKTTKWDNAKDKWKAAQVQQMLVSIVKASRPGGDFVAHYVPSDPKAVSAEDFQKAAKMWVNWWIGGGKSLERFKDFAD